MAAGGVLWCIAGVMNILKMGLGFLGVGKWHAGLAKQGPGKVYCRSGWSRIGKATFCLRSASK